MVDIISYYTLNIFIAISAVSVGVFLVTLPFFIAYVVAEYLRKRAK